MTTVRTHPDRPTWIVVGTIFGRETIVFEGTVFEAAQWARREGLIS